jgi:hypothetical protein
MGRLCERPGCSDVAAMAYGFDVDRLLVWLSPRDPDGGDPMRAGSLCKRHADAMVVPRGWTLDDRRDTTPRLFRTVAATEEPTEPPPRRTRTRKVVVEEPTPTEQLELVEPAVVPAVVEIVATVDPEPTVAIPWLPAYDEGDDLDGVLAADSPLLARAFKGTDRPR